MSTTDFDNVKNGDRVYSIVYGWGTVINLCKDNTFCVEFDVNRNTFYIPFNVNGYITGCNESKFIRTLYWGIPEIIAPKMKRKAPPKDVPVYVWDDGRTKYRRYSSGQVTRNGLLKVYSRGCTSWTAYGSRAGGDTITYDNWELA